jgi:hypothetical protein
LLQDGTLLPPPELEEGIIHLERKKSWWPFGGGDEKDFGGPLQRGDG